MTGEQDGGKLTPKQEAFVREYLSTGNASEAYRRAYNASGMADKVIHVKACELLKNGKVAVRVESQKAKLAEKHGVTAERVIRELALIGFANMSDYIRTTSEGDAYVDLSALTRDQAAAIGEVTSETYAEGKGEDAKVVKRTRFKLHDKKAALVDLGKHLGLFKEMKEISGPNGGPIEVTEQPRNPGDDRLAEMGTRYGQKLTVVNGGKA